MAAQQQSNSVGDLLAQDLAEHLGGDGVEPGEGFVEHQQVGFVEEGERQLHALLVAAGQALHGVAGAVEKAQPLEPGVGGACCGRSGEAGESGVVDEVVAHLHALVHAALCRHVAEALAGKGVDRVVLPGDRPVVEGQQPHDCAHGGGLAGTVGAEEADDLAAIHCEADPVERQQRAEPFGDVVDGKHPRRTYPEVPVTQRRRDRFAPDDPGCSARVHLFQIRTRRLQRPGTPVSSAGRPCRASGSGWGVVGVAHGDWRCSRRGRPTVQLHLQPVVHV